MTVQGNMLISAARENHTAEKSQDSSRMVLSERWPVIAAAMNRYQQNLAENFSRQAYMCVQNGLISGSDRHALARDAEKMGLRAFDAQLLIACAVRQWAIDQQNHVAVHKNSQKSIKREIVLHFPLWLKYATTVLIAILLDCAIIWYWFR